MFWDLFFVQYQVTSVKQQVLLMKSHSENIQFLLETQAELQMSLLISLELEFEARDKRITEDPMFVEPAFDDFNLVWGSPCIDAGDPASPPDPDGTVVDMGALYYDQGGGLLTVTLTPYNPPIQIPAIGGGFDFNIALTNNQAVPVTFDVWIMVQLPDSSWYGPVIGPVNLTLPANSSIARDRVQSVPGVAPTGIYTYEGRVGTYPDDIWNNDSFTFEKLETGDGSPVADWLNSGVYFAVLRANNFNQTRKLTLLK